MRLLICLLLLLCVACNSQPKKNIDPATLAAELDLIMVLDQKYRSQIQAMRSNYTWNSPQIQEMWSKQMALDENNLARILEIIDEVGGYPGKSLVGESASKTTFFVLQHAPEDIQEEHYEMIVNAAREGELNKGLAAMYQDRYLMHRGEPQIFGSQIRGEYVTDSLSGERIQRYTLWPIADTTHIDSLRMWNGMLPLEEYLNGFGLSRWDDSHF